MTLATALEQCGWTQAARHFDAAVEASIARDDTTYEREIAAFRAIASTWNTKEGGLSASGPRD
jgi:hypothetical protein